MAGRQIKGKGLQAFVKELSEGFAVLNPLILKQFQPESYQPLYQQLKKIQKELRSEPFPSNDLRKIRQRSICLQRLHTAVMILEHSAKGQGIALF